MSDEKEDSSFRDHQAKEGKKGGDKTLELYGKSFFSEIAKKRWKKK